MPTQEEGDEGEESEEGEEGKGGEEGGESDESADEADAFEKDAYNSPDAKRKRDVDEDSGSAERYVPPGK